MKAFPATLTLLFASFAVLGTAGANATEGSPSLLRLRLDGPAPALTLALQDEPPAEGEPSGPAVPQARDKDIPKDQKPEPAAAPTAATATASTAQGDANAGKKPLYMEWWFWAAAAAVVAVGTVGIIVLAGGDDGANRACEATLGCYGDGR